MDGKIKILFYILIGIGYLFVRLYQSAKSAQNSRQLNKRPQNRKSSEELFRELQKTLIPEPEKAVKSKPKPKPVLSKKEEHMAKAAELKSHIKRRNKHYKPIQPSKLKRKNIHVEMQTEKKSEETHSPVMDFDPRQAVIFSEILRRPQY